MKTHVKTRPALKKQCIVRSPNGGEARSSMLEKTQRPADSFDNTQVIILSTPNLDLRESVPVTRDEMQNDIPAVTCFEALCPLRASFQSPSSGIWKRLGI